MSANTSTSWRARWPGRQSPFRWHAPNPAPAPDRLNVFTSSWKDRPDRRGCQGTRRGRRRSTGAYRCACSTCSGTASSWPPIEWLTGRRYDVVPLPSPAAAPPSARAARVVTIHDLYFLDHPERTPRKSERDYAVLAASHARRADGIVVTVQTRRAPRLRASRRARRTSVRLPAGTPAWLHPERVRHRQPRRLVPAVRRHARTAKEHRGRCSTLTAAAGAARRRPAARPRGPRHARGSGVAPSRIAAPRWPAACDTGVTWGRRHARACWPARACWSSRRSTRASACRLARSDVARHPRRRVQPRGTPGGGRRRRGRAGRLRTTAPQSRRVSSTSSATPTSPRGWESWAGRKRCCPTGTEAAALYARGLRVRARAPKEEGLMRVAHRRDANWGHSQRGSAGTSPPARRLERMPDGAAA